MTNGHVLDPRSLARIAGVVSFVTAIIAAVVAITIAAQARRWLGAGFAGVPPRIGEAGSILLNNERFVLGLGAAAWVEQFRLRQIPIANRTFSPLTLLGLAVDIIVPLAALVNVALVGLAVGAYGWRMLGALLPHGPFEVCAYCIAANLFVTARRRPLARREWVAAGAASLVLLAVAALLETFAWLG